MKQQPELHVLDVLCATCGTVHSIRSTAGALTVDVCSNCHPAYTGVEQSTIGGSRTDRFNRRRALATA